jgi:hypothetical protein
MFLLIDMHLVVDVGPPPFGKATMFLPNVYPYKLLA